jgi:hypothetical protein
MAVVACCALTVICTSSLRPASSAIGASASGAIVGFASKAIEQIPSMACRALVVICASRLSSAIFAICAGNTLIRNGDLVLVVSHGNCKIIVACRYRPIALRHAILVKSENVTPDFHCDDVPCRIWGAECAAISRVASYVTILLDVTASVNILGEIITL